MEYKIAIGDSWYTLEKEVNALLLKGWVPQGGVCQHTTGGNWIQSMIKNN